MKEIDCNYTDEVVCPWCGYEMSNSWELGVDDGEYECDECGKSFECYRDVKVTYSTSKSKYGTCSSCDVPDVVLKSEHSSFCKITDVCEKCLEEIRAKAIKQYAEEINQKMENKK